MKHTGCCWFAVLIMLVFWHAPCAGDPNETALLALRQKMQELQKGHVVTVDDREILVGEPEVILAELQVFEKDPVERVRWEAHAIGWRIAIQSDEPQIRRDVVSSLIRACSDPSGLVRESAAEFLLAFTAEAFTEDTKTWLRALVASDKPERGMILVAGVADLRDQAPKLRALLADETRLHPETPGARGWYGSIPWTARMALGRMGSRDDIERCIELVESEPDPVLRVGRLLQHLAFIRQPRAIALLQAYLESDKGLPPEQGEGAPLYAQYALNLLALTLDNFPVRYKRSPAMYPQEDIELARTWMRAQQQFKFLTVMPDRLMLW